MRAARRRSSERGSTLIEVLVAIIVLAIGLVGGLRLQTESLRQSSDSRYVVVAATYAQDLMDQIAYARGGSSATYSLTLDAATPTSGPLQTWVTNLKRDLPKARASVTCTAPVCTIEIRWTPPGHDEVKAQYAVRT
ncbi:MAG: prepilin-type N-terminal cleavage/methylation domain-containing protein [Rhodocyclaceae bacterium]